MIGEDLVLQIKENIRLFVELANRGVQDRLSLVDLRGCFADQGVMAAYKEAAALLSPYIEASAVVGITGFQRSLLELVNKAADLGCRPFDSLEEAKDWLVSDSRL